MIAFAGEGLTDFIIIKNLLVGFFNDKNLAITRLLPRETEPVGWGNLLNYLTTTEFRDGVEYADFTIIQIDTDKCEEWKEIIKHIGDDVTQNENFIDQVKSILIKRIGNEFYITNRDKIFFAICVHDVECWLLPFNAHQPAHYSKIVGCQNAIERIANKKGFSIHQKNYQESKHYEELSREMKNHKILMEKYTLNVSLKFFINTLLTSFPNKSLKKEQLQ